MRMKLAAAVALALALAACKSVPTTRIKTLAVVADPDANGGYATALDVVFAYTPDAAAALPASGPEWFQKSQALLDNQASALQVVHVQLPPSRSALVALPQGYARAVGVYSFANYIPAPGQARGNLTPFSQVTIRLSKESIAYLQQ